MSQPQSALVAGRQRTIDADVKEHPFNAIDHLDELVKYAFVLLGSIEDAEDVAMEVIGAVHRAGARFAPKGEPKLYLFGIARRKVMDKLRARRRRVGMVSSPP